jgi:hypothetical protein
MSRSYVLLAYLDAFHTPCEVRLEDATTFGTARCPQSVSVIGAFSHGVDFALPP